MKPIVQIIIPIALIAVSALYFFVIVEYNALDYVKQIEIRSATKTFLLPLIFNLLASFYMGIVFVCKILLDIFKIDHDKIFVYACVIASHLFFTYIVSHNFGPEWSQQYKDVVQGIFLSILSLYPYLIYMILRLLSFIRPREVDRD
jgi:hypothetical protein